MKLLVIEGLDGAGKSTQISLLGSYLKDNGFSCEFMHFPRTDSKWFGELIARFLRGEFGSLSEVDPYLVAMLYAGDREGAAGIIRKWFDEGKIVLLDRYTYSNIAYQCAKIKDHDKQEVLRDWIMRLEFEYFAIPKPDINIFLDVPFSFTQNKLTRSRNGDDRRYLNGLADIHESSLNFQSRVRDMYLRIASTDSSLAVVNCSDSNGRILRPKAIFNLVLQLLKEKNLPG